MDSHLFHTIQRPSKPFSTVSHNASRHYPRSPDIGNPGIPAPGRSPPPPALSLPKGHPLSLIPHLSSLIPYLRPIWRIRRGEPDSFISLRLRASA